MNEKERMSCLHIDDAGGIPSTVRGMSCKILVSRITDFYNKNRALWSPVFAFWRY